MRMRFRDLGLDANEYTEMDRQFWAGIVESGLLPITWASKVARA